MKKSFYRLAMAVCILCVLANLFIAIHAATSKDAEPAATVYAAEQMPEVVQAEEEKVVETVCYAFLPGEREAVEATIMAEAGGESHEGKMLVAQCILNACLTDGIRPTEALVRYQYASTDRVPTEEVRQAVSAVFDRGETVTGENILYFYSPANMPNGVSEWHETQDFVLELGGHRFFKEWDAK